MKKDAGWDAPELVAHKVGDELIPMSLWLEFLGYFVSEGYTHLHVHERPARVRNRVRNGKSYVATDKARVQTDYLVGICQNDGDKADIMGRCLEQLPFTFYRGKNGWTTNNKNLWEELAPLGKAHRKHLPDYTKAVSRRQANILLDALILGDGTRGTQLTYYTSSVQLADDVQELALKAGFAADVRQTNRIGRRVSNGTTRYVECQVSIKADRVEPHPDGGWTPEKVPYCGKVFCVTVPNHIVYVRRNGKAVWCGNSGWGSMQGYAWMKYGADSIGTEAVWGAVDPISPPIDFY